MAKKKPEVMLSIKVTYEDGDGGGEGGRSGWDKFLFSAGSAFRNTTLLKWFLYLP